MKLKFYLLALISVFFLMISCDEEALSPDSETAEDNAKAEGTVSDVFGIVNPAITAKKALPGDCFTVTPDLVAKTITIAFPDAGCTLDDGKLRKGKIIVKPTGTWRTVGSKLETTFNNYQVDGATLTGTITVVCTAVLPTPSFTETSNNMVLTLADGKTITWNSERTFTWKEGAATPLVRLDDVYEFNSTFNGKNRKGGSFTSIGKNLVHKNTCKDKFVSGTIEITSDKGLIKVDFGTGECDHVVTVTQNGISATIND